MGPAGSGKTTVGELLAAHLGWEFVDGDSFHSPANIEKMAQGIPLDDNDRAPWLNAIRNAMLQWEAQRRNVVLACSALKRSYREQLQASQFADLEEPADAIIIYVSRPPEEIVAEIRKQLTSG